MIGYSESRVIPPQTASTNSAMIWRIQIAYANQTISIPLYNTTGHNFEINWGDGSLNSVVTVYDDSDLSHTYQVYGTYYISFTGECKGIYINNNAAIRIWFKELIQFGEVSMTIFLRAFFGLSATIINLTTNPIPTSCQIIGDYAFSKCSQMTGDFIVPDGVTSIGVYALYDCSRLDNIVIPSSVTSIKDFAMVGINPLTVYILNPIPPTLGLGIFGWSAPSGLVIKVPAASVAAYKTATGWSTYASKIIAI